MKKLLILTMLLVLAAGSNYAQWFQQRGLEIYNPWFHNPAFVGPEQSVQIDLSAFNFRWNSGAWGSVMTTRMASLSRASSTPRTTTASTTSP